MDRRGAIAFDKIRKSCSVWILREIFLSNKMREREKKIIGDRA